MKRGRVPQEAIIGIVYVVASAAAILVADRVPRGGEAIKDILVGSLLWVTWPAILKMAAVYARRSASSTSCSGSASSPSPSSRKRRWRNGWKHSLVGLLVLPRLSAS